MATYRQQTGILGAITTCPSCVTPIKNIAGGSYASSSLACASTDIVNNFYFEGNIIETGVTVYTDSGLLNTFVGDNGWYRVDSQDATRSMLISSSGEVGPFITLCNP